MAGGFVVLLAFAEPIKLLRQKIGRAGVRAGAAADAAFFLFRLAHFARRRRQQAVGDFHDRHVEPRQGEAHQRPAHNYHRIAAWTETGIVEQMADRSAEARPDVARTRDRFPGQGDDALGQRLAVDYRAFHRIGGADVLHQHADVRGASAVRYLLAGKDLRQLFRAAGGIFRGDHAQGNTVRVG